MSEKTNSFNWLIGDESTGIDEKSLNNSRIFNKTKSYINRICIDLTEETRAYQPQQTIDDIESYINAEEKMVRMLYSEINNYLLNLDAEGRVIFLTNVEKLLLYALGDSSVSDDAMKIVVKLYDHTQLINYQVESMNDVFKQRLSDAKIDLQMEIKGVEKEYITILGIFTAVILAFVGSFTFSTSVLNNVSNTEVFKLIGIALVIGLVFFNVIHYLLQFLREINGKIDLDETGKPKTNCYFNSVNGILCLLIIITIVAFGIVEIYSKSNSCAGVQCTVDDYSQQAESTETTLNY